MNFFFLDFGCSFFWGDGNGKYWHGLALSLDFTEKKRRGIKNYPRSSLLSVARVCPGNTRENRRRVPLGPFFFLSRFQEWYDFFFFFGSFELFFFFNFPHCFNYTRIVECKREKKMYIHIFSFVFHRAGRIRKWKWHRCLFSFISTKWNVMRIFSFFFIYSSWSFRLRKSFGLWWRKKKKKREEEKVVKKIEGVKEGGSKLMMHCWWLGGLDLMDLILLKKK